MERALPIRRRGFWNLCREYPYSIFFAVIAVALAVPMCLRRSGDWMEVFLPAARLLWSGKVLYPNDIPYVYPPASAFLAGIFLPPPPLIGRVLWYGVNVAALVLLLRGAWTLSGGGQLEGPRARTTAVPRREHAIALIGVLGGIFFVFDSLTNQQTDLILAALMIGGCLLLERAHTWTAALLFGLAAALKCTPLLWAPYLASRGQWSASVVVLAATVGFTALPDVIVPPPQPGWRGVAWARQYLADFTKKDSAVGSWHSAVNYNHSLAGVAHRLVKHYPTWHGNDMTISPRESYPSPLAMKGLVYGTGMALVILALLASWRGRQEPAAPARVANNDGLPLLAQRAQVTAALEYSLVLLLMLLLSPMSSKPHFCTMILPGFCLARLALERRDRVIGALLAAACLAVLVSNKDLLGEKAYDFVIWYGSVFWATALLYAGCCYALWKRGAAAGALKAPLAASVRAATVRQRLALSETAS